MKHYFIFILILFAARATFSQNVYTIKADSVKLTGCDSDELIIENHTQAVPGFLFNTGNGRTQFRRGLLNLGGGAYQIGADTLRVAEPAIRTQRGSSEEYALYRHGSGRCAAIYHVERLSQQLRYLLCPIWRAMNLTQGWQLFNDVNVPLSRPNVVEINTHYPKLAFYARRRLI